MAPAGDRLCWAMLERSEELSAYWVKFALFFLGHVPDEARATAAIKALRGRTGEEGSMPVPAGPRTSGLPR